VEGAEAEGVGRGVDGRSDGIVGEDFSTVEYGRGVVAASEVASVKG